MHCSENSQPISAAANLCSGGVPVTKPGTRARASSPNITAVSTLSLDCLKKQTEWVRVVRYAARHMSTEMCHLFSYSMYKEKKVYITVMVFSSTHEHMRLGDHIKQNKELFLMTFIVLSTQWMTGLFLHYLLKNQDKKLESYETNTYGHWRSFLGREAEESLSWILRLQGSLG